MTDFNTNPITVPANNGLWYVLRFDAKPSVVAMMQADMVANGYETFMPQRLRRFKKTVNRVRSTTPIWVSEHLYGRYMFARALDGVRQRKKLCEVYGIEGRIGSVSQAAIDFILSEEQSVDGMRGYIDEADRRYVPPEEWRAALAPGTSIEVESFGTYLKAVVTANTGDGNIWALIEAFGRQTPVSVRKETRVRAAMAS